MRCELNRRKKRIYFKIIVLQSTERETESVREREREVRIVEQLQERERQRKKERKKAQEEMRYVTFKMCRK
jgi:hypothetical protein